MTNTAAQTRALVRCKHIALKSTAMPGDRACDFVAAIEEIREDGTFFLYLLNGGAFAVYDGETLQLLADDGKTPRGNASPVALAWQGRFNRTVHGKFDYFDCMTQVIAGIDAGKTGLAETPAEAYAALPISTTAGLLADAERALREAGIAPETAKALRDALAGLRVPNPNLKAEIERAHYSAA